MTKKDYIIIASAVNELKHSGVTNGAVLDKVVDKLVDILCVELKNDNSAFKADIFAAACTK